MITIEQILSRCTEEQLETIPDSSRTIVKHMEFVTGRPCSQLAVENEQFWKVYGLNALTLSELAARAQGHRKQIVEPIK